VNTIRVRGPVGIHRWHRVARGGLATLVTVLAVAGCSAAQGPPAGSGSPAQAPPVPAPPAAPSPGARDTAPPGAPEVNPSGDIPDNQAYVAYRAPDGLFTVSVPEGWSRTAQGPATVFTDKLNSVRVEAGPRPQPPDPATAQAQEVPMLQGSVPGYRPGQVSTVPRAAGPAVLITYQASSPPDPVTGKSSTDAVERYEFWRAGTQVTLTLSAPQGADNVDPWRRVTDSLRWQR